jgi:hypothetical protein
MNSRISKQLFRASEARSICDHAVISLTSQRSHHTRRIFFVAAKELNSKQRVQNASGAEGCLCDSIQDSVPQRGQLEKPHLALMDSKRRAGEFYLREWICL